MGLNNELLLTWGIAAVATVAALFLLYPAIRHRVQRRREQRVINSLGLEQIRDVIIDDGMDGTVVLERLMLTPEGLLVLMTLRREGNLFGGERIDTWVQVLGKRTIRFPNPLYTLETLLAAVRYHVPGIKVDARVLFLGNCAFPKGQPKGAWTLADVPLSEGKVIPSNIVPVLQEGWNRIKERSKAINRRTQAYLLSVDDAPCRKRVVSALLLLAAMGGWLAWRILGR